MAHIILADVAASVSELKKNSMGTVAAGEGATVAILNRNEPAFYCVPAATYASLIERLDDFELAFHPAARKEWQELDNSVRTQFKKKLTECLDNPRVPSAQLHGHPNRYKIKLQTPHHRLSPDLPSAG